MKDNEYYGPIADGYTLFGLQLNTQLGYQINKNLSIEAGVFLRKDFGNKKFDDILPTFSLRYTKKDFKMIFGNLDGSLNHGLLEPLYNFERVITNRLESGAQFILNKRYIDVDAWIDWQNAIYKGAAGSEKIWTGVSSNLLKVKSGKFEFKIPFQFTILHSGGQIDTGKALFYTHWNFDGGLRVKYNVNARHVQNILIDARYVGKVDYAFNPVQSQSNGSGFMGNIGFTAFNTDVLFSYWQGHNYTSDYGGFLYSSASSTVSYANTFENIRNLIIMRVTKRLRLADRVLLTLRAEPYYDLRLHLLEYSFGFYISLDEQVWFKKAPKS